MNYPKTIFLSLALLAMHSLNAEVVTYPAGAGVKTLNDFSVEVRQGSGPWLLLTFILLKLIGLMKKVIT